MRVFDVECGGGSGSGVVAAGSTGTISSAFKASWAVSAAFALVPSCPGSAKSTTSRPASFRDGDVGPDVAAAAAAGNNAAHLRHPPFRSDI
jgi:hypothetical protein